MSQPSSEQLGTTGDHSAAGDATWPPDLSSDSLRPDTTVGNYRLIEQIGAGGMGVVYKAEQLRPVRRIVALKLVKLGMDTREVVARFESERQALAVLEHPGIARVYDAGATQSGRPYFVMEFVPGVPITQYCDEHRVSTRRRLELFERVCHAVQHAHFKGILHRDLKPSNILVTEVDAEPQAKVIDFGVAKAVSERDGDSPLATRAGQLVGTPVYMSPEQASGEAEVDTRADVYSLGVVLYELLSGAPPIDPTSLRGADAARIASQIREAAPVRPSTRATSAERQRELRGDLDRIALKAVHKDRALRYDTAAALADDVRRHLSDEPIRARPPTLAYQARKFARRNRVLVGATVMAMAAVILGAVMATVGLMRARQALARETTARQAEADQRRRAQSTAEVNARVNKLLGDMLAAPNPDRALGKPVLVRDIMDQAARELDAMRDQPLVEAALRHTVGTTFHGLGEYEAAHQQLSRALAIRQKELGPADHATLATMTMDVSALSGMGREREAEQVARQALQTARNAAQTGGAVGGADLSDVVMAAHSLGTTLNARGLYAESIALLTDALPQAVKTFGDDDERTNLIRTCLGTALRSAGRADEADPLLQRAFESQRLRHGPDSPVTLTSQNDLAVNLVRQARWPEAADLLRDLVERRARVEGPEHRNTLIARNILSGVLMDMGRLDESEQVQREVLDARRRTMGPDHPDTLVSANNFIDVLLKRRKLADAEALAREVLERRRRVLGPDAPETLTSTNRLGICLLELDRPVEAEQAFRDAAARRAVALGKDHPQTLISEQSLAEALVRQSKHDQAEPLMARVVTVARGRVPDETLGRYVAAHGLCLAQLRRWSEAEVELREAYDLLKKPRSSGQPDKRLRPVVTALVNVSRATGNDAEAQRWSQVEQSLQSTSTSTTAPTAR